MSEKRKNTRLQCFVPVEGKQGSSFDQTKTVDFSKGGLGFVSYHHIPLNKEITIQIDFGPDEPPVFVMGRVTWVSTIPNSDQYRIGIAFKNYYKGSKSRISQYFHQTN